MFYENTSSGSRVFLRTWMEDSSVDGQTDGGQ